MNAPMVCPPIMASPTNQMMSPKIKSANSISALNSIKSIRLECLALRVDDDVLKYRSDDLHRRVDEIQHSYIYYTNMTKCELIIFIVRAT